MNAQYMKNNIIYIVLGALIMWNGWLTWFKDPEPTPAPTIDYELLDSMYAQKETAIAQHDTVFNELGVAITRDSLLIHSADRRMRDSLRNLVNPR